MSHPDPLFDPDNSYEDNMNYADDVDASNYDDYNDFYDDEDNSGEVDWYDESDDSMDGDAESAFGSCGWGVDEYYNPDCDYGDDW
jgi:hypothetical protein